MRDLAELLRALDAANQAIAELSDELTEARSEIRRHHELIGRLRDGLSWALDELVGTRVILARDREGRGSVVEEGDDRWLDQRVEDLRRLLNREVG